LLKSPSATSSAPIVGRPEEALRQSHQQIEAQAQHRQVREL